MYLERLQEFRSTKNSFYSVFSIGYALKLFILLATVSSIL